MGEILLITAKNFKSSVSIYDMIEFFKIFLWGKAEIFNSLLTLQMFDKHLNYCSCLLSELSFIEAFARREETLHLSE